MGNNKNRISKEKQLCIINWIEKSYINLKSKHIIPIL